MHVDASDLRDFYHRPLGVVVRRLLGKRIRNRWRSVEGLTVIGLGFTTPYLGIMRSEAARIGAFMPVTQGALVWPANAPNLSVLVDEAHLPVPDNSVDRLLVVHGLEGAERVQPMFREMWRVLQPEGRLLMIVPNRRGLWARFDATPFGHGRPYSRSQLERLLTDAMFQPLDWSWAMHVPPIERKLVLQSAQALERLGQRIYPRIGGLIVVEAKKEVMAPAIRGSPVRSLGGLVTVRGGGVSRGGPG